MDLGNWVVDLSMTMFDPCVQLRDPLNLDGRITVYGKISLAFIIYLYDFR